MIFRTGGHGSNSTTISVNETTIDNTDETKIDKEQGNKGSVDISHITIWVQRFKTQVELVYKCLQWDNQFIFSPWWWSRTWTAYLAYGINSGFSSLFNIFPTKGT